MNGIIMSFGSTLLSPEHRSSGQRIKRVTTESNDITYQMDIIDACTIFSASTKECTFYSTTQGLFSKIEKILGFKMNLSKKMK